MLTSKLIEKLYRNDADQAVLNLSCCDIDDPKVMTLCTALAHNTHVHSLLLNWNQLTDIGANSIAKLMRTNNYLERVEFAGNPGISDHCIHALQQEFNAKFSNKTGFRQFAINPHRRIQPVKEVYDLSEKAFSTHLQYAKHPIIIRGAIKKSTTTTWTPSYLSQILGEKEVDLSIWSSEMSLKKTRLPLREVVTLITDNVSVNSLSRRLYVQKYPLHEFQEIEHQISPPLWADLAHTKEFSPYLWFGQNDTITPLHFDEFDNIFTQVYGQKSIILFPPTETRYLFQRMPDHISGLRNIHRSHVPNLDRLDSFSKHTQYATGYHAHLRESDVLFIPKQWWHEVKSLSEASISVNYWFPQHVLLPEVDTLFSDEWFSYSEPEKKAIITQTLPLLLKHNAPNYVSEKMPFTLLQLAVRFDVIEVVKGLIEHSDTELNQAPCHSSPLLLAIIFNRQDILDLLLKTEPIRASVNEDFFSYRCTPVELATQLGHHHLIERLSCIL